MFQIYFWEKEIYLFFTKKKKEREKNKYIFLGKEKSDLFLRKKIGFIFEEKKGEKRRRRRILDLVLEERFKEGIQILFYFFKRKKKKLGFNKKGKKSFSRFIY